MTAVQETPAVTPPEPGSVKDAVVDYVERVRGGDVGALPAVLGLVVLTAVFAGLRGTKFTNAFNVANLVHQAAPVMVIAMGLVFVLLLGEIDLSAGYTAGTGAAVMGIVLTRHHQPWYVAVLAGLAVGAVIGALIGVMVSRLGIPSFVVTLAAFLGLQGVLLKLVGDGGSIRVADQRLVDLNNANLPIWAGWVLAAVVVGGYAFVSLTKATTRRKDGLTADAVSVVLAKIAVIALLLGLTTLYLSRERSRNALVTSIKGVPQVIVLLLLLLVGLNFLLGRTAFGRHVYAVGGNQEAARRAGINVPRVKLLCFVISSTLAAVGGFLLASYNNSVSPTTGGSDTLLYAVGAAVIGGTSLFGGKGKIMDPVLGSLVIAMIINGMGLLQQPASVVYMVTGGVLLLAASVDATSRRKAASTGRV
ncbi:MAG: transporter permease [Frankiales bacterium]|nr:transporter permease [Frankiales bacterium]